jgi:hypothetical protein
MPRHHARRPHPEPVQRGRRTGPPPPPRRRPLHHPVEHRVLRRQVPHEAGRDEYPPGRTPPSGPAAHHPQQRHGDRQREQRVGGEQEARGGVADEEEVGHRDGQGTGRRGQGGRRRPPREAVRHRTPVPNGGCRTPDETVRHRPPPAHRDDGAQHRERRHGEPPPRLGRRRQRPGARPAQSPPGEPAELVVEGEVPPQAALDAGGVGQPPAESAVGGVRLDDPLDGPGGQPARQHTGRQQRLPHPPPAPGGEREDEQRHRRPHGVRRPHPRHEGGARAQSPQGGTVAPVGAGAQEAGGRGEGAVRDPQVGHGLRPVEKRDPQAGEEGTREGEDAGREQPAPGAQREVQREPGEHGQVHPQQHGRRRPGGDRRDQQRHAPGAGRAEEGGGRVPADLADVHRLVPAEPQVRADEGELGDGEQEGHDGERCPAVPARRQAPAGRA